MTKLFLRVRAASSRDRLFVRAAYVIKEARMFSSKWRVAFAVLASLVALPSLAHAQSAIAGIVQRYLRGGSARRDG